MGWWLYAICLYVTHGCKSFLWLAQQVLASFAKTRDRIFRKYECRVAARRAYPIFHRVIRGCRRESGSIFLLSILVVWWPFPWVLLRTNPYLLLPNFLPHIYTSNRYLGNLCEENHVWKDSSNEEIGITLRGNSQCNQIGRFICIGRSKLITFR